jgi:hypothetical protein
VRQSPGSKDLSTYAEDIVGFRYQATTGKDVANQEGLACAVVRSKEFESVTAL